MARERLPASVKDQVRGSRVLGWGRWQGSRDELGYAVATMAGLHLLRTSDSPATLITWDTVLRAQWEDPLLEVVFQPDPEQAPVSRSLTLPDPGQVPEAVRDRVTSNVFFSSHVNFVGNRGARMIARRTPDGSGIHWTVVFDAGLDGSDPELRARAQDELAALRSQLGV